MKKTAITAVVFGLIGLVSVAAWAAPRGMGYGQGQGPGFQQMTPEQRAEFQKNAEEWQKAHAAFLQDTVELRKQLADKRIEMRALTSQPGFDRAQAVAMAKEMIQLRGKLAEKRVDHMSKFSNWGLGFGPRFGKGGPVAGGFCPNGGSPRGRGYHHRGGGHGYGGHNWGGGYGPGGGACFR
ncbi:periplasmic heavy metal sensor [Dethiosulfatarculus sandiegensis]|uniref:Zinc resistance protein n=1 Tax=Dethiosulfatarculus sandiegensis TaxID=1429043 RepID=A0A0D2J1J6_9BACT|nr:periplasmic heavy metal sensor [Dethiosulfatarculus sandiegensis]KIX12074.1 zinc resistance protein [Dethiosulfatarculus sandiegensis]